MTKKNMTTGIISTSFGRKQMSIVIVKHRHQIFVSRKILSVVRAVWTILKNINPISMYQYSLTSSGQQG